MHAIEVAETGGPEVLTYVEKPQPSPGPGEVLIKAEAIGVNFLDTYFRSGQYPRELPFVLGNEVCGTVEAVGDDVAALAVGDRVVTAQANGAYAEYALARSGFLRLRARRCRLGRGRRGPAQGHDGALPDQVDLSRCSRATPCWCMRARAVSGLILTQWATSLAARVITTVSTPEKAELSRKAGAVEVLDYPDDRRGIRRQDQGPHRRRRRRGLRRRRRRHVRRQHREPCHPRHAGAVRRVQRTGARRSIRSGSTPRARCS